jgi:hypothetical protein
MVRPWKAPEADDWDRPYNVVQLNGCLHTLRARVGHEGNTIIEKWSNIIQLFGQLHPDRVIEIRGYMNKSLSLFLDGLHNFRMAVSGGYNGDARRKIEEAIAVNVPYLGPFAVIHHKGVAPRVGRGNDSLIAL